jgi:adenosylcobinamide-phosphate synthase
MTSIASAPLILALALGIDRLIGDPAWLWGRVPHPVVLIGHAIDWLDRKFNDLTLGFEDRRRRGVLALALLVGAAGAIGWALDYGLATFAFAWAVEAIIVAVFLAQKNLLDHVAAVELGLSFGGIAAGRAAVAEIVGRDVSVLDESGVSRAAIESAAENFSDGVVAPAFWYLLLGLPGLFIYKAVNTSDSMIGNRSPRHAAFGWAAARFDDFLNFVPARLSALVIVATAAFAGCDARGALAAARRDAPKHKSPNAGWPEAALAGALGLALGGPRRYGSDEVDGAWLNPSGRADAAPGDIRAAIRLIDAAWALLLMLIALAAITLLSLAQ